MRQAILPHNDNNKSLYSLCNNAYSADSGGVNENRVDVTYLFFVFLYVFRFKEIFN